MTGQSDANLTLCIHTDRYSAKLVDTLASVSARVDEVCVGVGGDPIPDEVKTQFNVDVSHIADLGNAAAGRNAILQRATGRWCFWLEPGETLTEENGSKLQALAQADIVSSIGGFAFDIDVNSTSRVPYHDPVRLVRNLPEFDFEGYARTSIAPAISKTGREIRWCDIVISQDVNDQTAAEILVPQHVDQLELELQDKPGNANTLFRLASAHLDANQPERAMNLLKECVILSHPAEFHTASAYLLLSRLFSLEGNENAAWVVGQTGRRLFPQHPDLLFREANMLERIERWDDAISAYEQLIGLPGDLYYEGGDPTVLAFHGRHQLASTYRRLQKFDKAEEQWRHIIHHFPRFLPAWSGVIEMLAHQKRGDIAREMTDAMLEQPEFDVEARRLRSRIAIADGNLSEARQELEKAREENPNDVAALDHLCEFLFEHGPRAQAHTMLQQLVQVQPENASTHHNLGVIQLQQQNYDDAIKSLESSLETRPDGAHTWFCLAEAKEANGNLPGALTAWKKVVELVPDTPLATQAKYRMGEE